MQDQVAKQKSKEDPIQGQKEVYPGVKSAKMDWSFLRSTRATLPGGVSFGAAHFSTPKLFRTARISPTFHRVAPALSFRGVGKIPLLDQRQTVALEIPNRAQITASLT